MRVCMRVRYEVDKSQPSMLRRQLGEGRIRKRDAVSWGGADSEKGPCMSCTCAGSKVKDWGP